MILCVKCMMFTAVTESSIWAPNVREHIVRCHGERDRYLQHIGDPEWKGYVPFTHGVGDRMARTVRDNTKYGRPNDVVVITRKEYELLRDAVERRAPTGAVYDGQLSPLGAITFQIEE